MQASIVSFRSLDVWNRGMDLVDLVINQSKKLPRTEFDLRRQMVRAAVSIPANIAEGYRRKGRRGAYQNHISIAMGSQGELETELEIALRNAWLNRVECSPTIDMCNRVGAMLNKLHNSLDHYPERTSRWRPPDFRLLPLSVRLPADSRLPLSDSRQGSEVV